MQTIDSHVQFWKYNKSRLSKTVQGNKLMQQDYLPENLALNLQRNGVSGMIAVESEAKEVETRFLSELAATHPSIVGVIGWIDISAPDIEEKLEAFSSYTAVKGYRYDLGASTSLSDKVRGIAALKKYNYTFDLFGNTSYSTIADLISAHPDQPFILDDGGAPDIKQSLTHEWSSRMKDLATAPNVSCKLSGLLTLAKWKNWSPATFYPFLDVLFAAFGSERLLFGSDWPFLLLSGMYVQWKSLIEKYMEPMLDEDRENVFTLNAARVYGV